MEYVKLAAAIAFAAAVSSASATVTFDPTTGSGFVGKGDVQLALGCNNAQMQANASGLVFAYDITWTYDAVCTWVTALGKPGKKTHNVSIPRHSTANDQVAYDARAHKQVDGFFLTGFGSTSISGTVPIVGAACVGNEEDGTAHNGAWTSVSDPITSGGVLSVNSIPLGLF